MSKKIENLELKLDEDLDEKLSWLYPNFSQYRVLRKSVDARKKSDVHFVYSVEIFGKNETPVDQKFEFRQHKPFQRKPVIIGAGPAGLFAALRFVESGVPCVLFERGGETKERIFKIARHWRYGELDAETNVCYGEGGAGLFSDGKLITRIKSPHIPYVMHKLVEFGAPDEIKYLANPHVGSDRIRRVIPKMREYLKSKGCEFHFNTRIDKIETANDSQKSRVAAVITQNKDRFETDQVILATGHSAEDMYDHLNEIGVHMEGKSFALGLRVEHPQRLINQIQYRQHSEHPKLESANYKLTFHDKETNIGVYSFCMCPGGYVLSSSTDERFSVCNGMSNYNRNSPFANSAVVITIDHGKNFGTDLYGGLKFRRQLEAQAQEMVNAAGGKKEIPAQKVTDFFQKRSTGVFDSSSLSGVKAARLDQVIPAKFHKYFEQAFQSFESKMKGFYSGEAQFHGMESRTSSPLRVTRDADTLMSLSHEGLYPVGEGAGYAGGITSAACDGIKVAEKILETCIQTKTV